jgi:hypothetical protein
MVLNVLYLIIFSAAALPLQTPSSKSSTGQYQPAAILEVKEHPGGEIPATEHTPPIKRYDVSVQVKDKVYVVLVTPQPGTAGFETWRKDVLVLVKGKTMTFNDLLGRPNTAPIISQHPAPPKPNQ